MGQMCTNPLEYLIEEHGTDVGKFIAAEKTKQYVDQKFPQLKNQLGGKVDQFNKQTMGKIDEQAKQSVDKLTGKINQFKTSQGTAITAFESTSEKKFDELAGLGTLNTQIQGVKKASEQKLKAAKVEALKTADKAAEAQKQVIQNEKPKIPAYDNLPQCLKDKVWQDGQKKFGTEIEARKKKAQEVLSQVTDFQKLKGKIGGDVQTDQLKSITGNAQTAFNTVKTTISGLSGANALKGFFG